jgi:general secretion pathway protein K
LPEPYLPANRALVDVAELLLVRGFDQAAIDKLAPWVCALPKPTPVNVNTASAEGDQRGDSRPRSGRCPRWVAERGDGSQTLAEFRGKLSAAQALGLQENLLSVASDYFEVDLSVEFGRVRQRYLALYQRQGQNWPLLLWLQQR